MHAIPRLAALLAIFLPVVMAESFVPPVEGRQPFRRDRLPLDADRLIALSEHLTDLALDADATRADHRRRSAQLLALAQALHPANPRTRALLNQKSGKVGADPTAAPVKVANPRQASLVIAWQALPWLLTEEAGADANALGLCLRDVLSQLDPKHPSAKPAEAGSWTDWVADLAAFEASPATEEDTGTDEPAEVADTSETPAQGGPRFQLPEAEVLSAFWRRETERSPWQIRLMPLRMEASATERNREESRDFSLSFVVEKSSSLARDAEMLTRLLEKSHGKLPANHRIRLSGAGLAASVTSQYPQFLSAAAAVVADAAFRGKAPEATVLGLVDAEGNLSLPLRFWEQLRALADHPEGTRVILPAQAAELLPSFLALERPDLFLRHQILLARDWEEMVRFAAKEADEELAGHLAAFAEIQSKAGNQVLGTYVANRFVRQRLAELSQAMPAHASARMLAIQGAGERPVKIPKAILAAELRTALLPVLPIIRQDRDMPATEDYGRLDGIYEKSRSGVDALERYAENADKEWINKSRELTICIRTLSRVSRGRGDSVDQAIRSAFRSLNDTHKALLGDLNFITDGNRPLRADP